MFRFGQNIHTTMLQIVGCFCNIKFNTQYQKEQKEGRLIKEEENKIFTSRRRKQAYTNEILDKAINLQNFLLVQIRHFKLLR